MIQIPSETYKIEVGSLLESSLADVLNSKFTNSKKVILADENTFEHCVSFLTSNFDALSNAEIVVIPAGEENKTLEICSQVWETLSDYHIQRSDLLINVGGGMVTDMGGFIASVYKRGIPFINIPTSLLAMVDASAGGKTGIDLNHFKNQLGTFAHPELVICDPEFLQTLPKEELLWGQAEMLKHGIIASTEHWDAVKKMDLESIDSTIIAQSVTIKNDIVLKDFKEQADRKKLNLGHTIGHAIEGFMLDFNPLPHGRCVAHGILAESLLAHKFGTLSQADFMEIKATIENLYPELVLTHEQLDPIVNLMQQDKKNRGNEINFVGIKGIGEVIIDTTYTLSEIREVLQQLFMRS
jgi:3-dehydroquinate synthase